MLESFRYDRLLAATDFKFVAIGIVEKDRVITRAVLGTKFRTLQISSSDLSYHAGYLIDFRTAIHPERNPVPVRLVTRILGKAKERRRLVAANSVKCPPLRIRTIAR